MNEMTTTFPDEGEQERVDNSNPEARAILARLTGTARLEIDRAVALATVPDELSVIQGDALAKEGAQDGDLWRQPTGAHDAYPAGWSVTYNGKTYESLIPANVWAPDLDARWWKDLTTVPTPGAWSGAAVAYKVNDVVTYNGSSYKCLQAHTSQAGWTPSAVPALWLKL